VNGGGETEVRCAALQSAAQGAIADDGPMGPPALRGEQGEGVEHDGVPLACDELAHREEEGLAGEEVVGGHHLRSRACRAVEDHVEAFIADHALEKSGDRARVGHHPGRAAEDRRGTSRRGVVTAQVLVDVGAVDCDHIGDAEVVRQALGDGAVGQRLMGVHEVDAPAYRRRATHERIGEVARAVEEQTAWRLRDTRILGDDAVENGAPRLLAAAALAFVAPE